MVSNRTYERAVALANQFSGRALRFDEALQQMHQADIIICSTAAPHPVIQPDQVDRIMNQRKGRSLFFIDIAVPRDVHPDVHRIDNVYVYNIDDLQSIVTDNVARRASEISLAEAIIDDKSKEFVNWLAAYRSGQDQGFKHYSPRPASNDTLQ
jgi:glutamyl-tRNA reductase